jgi:hypothetical protein
MSGQDNGRCPPPSGRTAELQKGWVVDFGPPPDPAGWEEPGAATELAENARSQPGETLSPQDVGGARRAELPDADVGGGNE